MINVIHNVIGSGQRGPFVPTDLGTEKLVIWGRQTYVDGGKTDIAEDGETIRVFEDGSGNGNDCTQATAADRPTLRAADVSGNDALDFDGSTDHLILPDNFETVWQTSFAVCAGIKFADGNPASLEIWFGLEENKASNEDVVQIQLRTDGVVRFNYRVNGNFAVADTDTAVFSNGETEYVVLTCYFDADNQQFNIRKNKNNLALDATNDGDTSGVSHGSFNANVPAYIGAYNDEGSDGFHCDCNIVEGGFCLLKNPTLSDIENVESYIQGLI